MSKTKKILSIALVLVMVLGLFAACSASPEKKILGSWRDSTGKIGYDFKEDNTVALTFANFKVPVIGIDYKGTADGTYAISKGEDGNDYVTVEYKVLSSAVSETFMFAVEDNTLTLTNTSTGKVVTLIAYDEAAQATTVA